MRLSVGGRKNRTHETAATPNVSVTTSESTRVTDPTGCSGVEQQRSNDVRSCCKVCGCSELGTEMLNR